VRDEASSDEAAEAASVEGKGDGLYYGRCTHGVAYSHGLTKSVGALDTRLVGKPCVLTRALSSSRSILAGWPARGVSGGRHCAARCGLAMRAR
jgi:hypothetical protein